MANIHKAINHPRDDTHTHTQETTTMFTTKARSARVIYSAHVTVIRSIEVLQRKYSIQVYLFPQYFVIVIISLVAYTPFGCVDRKHQIARFENFARPKQWSVNCLCVSVCVLFTILASRMSMWGGQSGLVLGTIDT